MGYIKCNLSNDNINTLVLYMYIEKWFEHIAYSGCLSNLLIFYGQVLLDYAVPIAFVNGDKLADLALEFEMELQPTIDDLLSVLVNREDVEAIIKTPVSLHM